MAERNLNSQEVSSIADAWIAYQNTWLDVESRHDIDRDRSFDWAYGKLEELVDRNHHMAWLIITQIASRATDQHHLDLLVAGPLEDILASRPEYVEPVEELAHQNAPFRLALTGIWQSGMSDCIYRRVRKAADGPT